MRSGSEAALQFWLRLITSCPYWIKESSLLMLLDTLCMAAFLSPSWTQILQDTLLEAYQVRERERERKRERERGVLYCILCFPESFSDSVQEGIVVICVFFRDLYRLARWQQLPFPLQCHCEQKEQLELW